MVKPEKKKIQAVIKPKHKNKGNKLKEKLENADQQDAPSRIKRMLSYREREVERRVTKTPKHRPNPEMTLDNTNLEELERKSAHLSMLAAKKKTKKYLKKQEFLNRKVEKPEDDLGMITEQRLLNQGKVKFQDFALEPPTLTIPKDRSKKPVLLENVPEDVPVKVKALKEINISSITGQKLGRTRKLKLLPEAERNALMAQRQKAIDLYRLAHKK